MPKLGEYKEQYCCICHNKVDGKAHRLVHQEWEKTGYGLYKNKHNFDFCDNCFKTFKKWIIRHKKEGKL